MRGIVLCAICAAFLVGVCGCWGNAAWADSGTIRVGAIFSKTGEAAQNNFQFLQATRFAVDTINSSGGLLGKKIELIEYDNCSNSIKSKLVARQAVKDGVVAVVGASWSDHSLAIAPVLQKAGIPMITPSSTNPRLTKIGNYIFRACFSDSFQGEVIANFISEEFHAKTAALIVNVASSYSLDLAENFSKRFTALGGKILAEEGYKEGRTDFSAILARIQALHPDVLFVPGYDESGYIVKQAQDLGLETRFVGGDGWGINQFLANGGQELKKGYYTSHWSQYLDTPETKRFLDRYQTSYTIDETTALGYDSVMLLADAIQRAGSLDRKAIRDALAATKDFHAVSGAITFDGNGDPIKGVNIMEIVDGKQKYYKTVLPQ